MRISSLNSIIKLISIFKLALYDRMDVIIPGVLENIFSKVDDNYEELEKSVKDEDIRYDKSILQDEVNGLSLKLSARLCFSNITNSSNQTFFKSIMTPILSYF
jgi:hypothetical protein